MWWALRPSFSCHFYFEAGTLFSAFMPLSVTSAIPFGALLLVLVLLSRQPWPPGALGGRSGFSLTSLPR